MINSNVEAYFGGGSGDMTINEKLDYLIRNNSCYIEKNIKLEWISSRNTTATNYRYLDIASRYENYKNINENDIVIRTFTSLNGNTTSTSGLPVYTPSTGELLINGGAQWGSALYVDVAIVKN